MIPSSEVREPNLQDYLQIFSKRIWLILGLFVLAAGFVGLHGVLTPKVYEAKATVVVERSILQLIDPRRDPMPSQASKEDYETQLKLLKSHFLAERVIRKLDLVMTPQKILSIVDVSPAFRTNMVVISVKGRDPELITKIANTWSREFISQDIERRVGTAKYGVARLESQLSDTLVKMEAAEEELNKYVKTHGELSEKEQLISRLKRQRSALEREITEKSGKLGMRSAIVVSLREQLEGVRAWIKTETDELSTIQEDFTGYNVLKKKAGAYQKIYEDLIIRSRELDTVQGLAVSNIRVIGMARVPRVPVEMPTGTKVTIVLVSLIGGLFICFLMEYTDLSLQTAEEVEFYARMPFLGHIPPLGDEFKDRKEVMQKAEMVCHIEPYSQTAEAFRNIEVSVMFSSSDEKPLKTILVTSAVKKEGKTFVAANLATIFARAKEPTLLIDADLRGGGLSKVFKASNAKGLSSVIRGECSIEEAQMATPVPNLFLLPAGPLFPTPVELLEDENLAEILDELREKYSRVIIDAPAIRTGSEAIVLADKCDGLMYVIKTGSTPYKVIDATRRRIEGRANVIGAVLNNSEMRKDMTYYYHYFSETIKSRVKKA